MSGPVSKSKLLKELTWKEIDFAPAQVFGGVRLVPLLRANYREDLRLSRHVYAGSASRVALPDNTTYRAFIPHGLIAHWNNDGEAVLGTQITDSKSEHNVQNKPNNTNSGASPLIRMVKRSSAKALRFLPQHVAMEGYLSHHFGGPDIAWSEYRRETIKYGLGHRMEFVQNGRQIAGLEDALRVFELHECQIGMLVFVADTVAAVFLVPHPDDYKALHRTLITDFYGELIYYYGLYAIDTKLAVPSINKEQVSSFDHLHEEINRISDDWANWHKSHTGALFNTPINAKGVYNFKPFTLQRFSTGFDPDQENHIGDVIVDKDNVIQYLKTFRLSANQCKRAYLLSKLAEADWNLDDCATLFSCTRKDLIVRLKSAGFSYLVHQHILDAKR